MQLALPPPHPSTTSNRNYGEGKAGVEPENIAPIVPAAPNPQESYVQHLGAGAWGGRGKGSWSPPGRAGGGQESAEPRVHTQPAARAAPSGAPAAPAGRKRSLCGCDSRGCPCSAGGRRESGSQRTFQVLGCGLGGRPCGGFPPGSRFPAAEGCAPAAAPLAPASARLRPPGKTLLGGIFQPGGPTSRPSTWRRTARSEGPVHAAPP